MKYPETNEVMHYLIDQDILSRHVNRKYSRFTHRLVSLARSRSCGLEEFPVCSRHARYQARGCEVNSARSVIVKVSKEGRR